MWAEQPIGDTTDLRQGDLIRGLVLPSPDMPLNYVQSNRGLSATGPYQAVVAAKRRDYLVVSQCCTIERDGRVALAPLRRTPRLSPEQQLPYWWETPDDVPVDSDYQFAYSAIALDPIPDVLAIPGEGRLLVVEFADIQSLGGLREEVIAGRIARMTPEGRRRLRLRLMWFFGRAEDEDRTILESRGISPER